MVRLLNDKNLDILTNVVYGILRIQREMTNIKEVNNPNIEPCIYAMWHANQFCVHGFQNKKNVNVLISNSMDGEIVARICKRWGFQVARGSSKRKGAVSSSLQLIDKLKNGQSVAIMVDGPHGPLHKVKQGAIRLAKDTGVPIVPVCWYSPQRSFIHLPSWDKMAVPFGPCRIINLYGEPIYIDKDADTKENIRKVRDRLLELDARIASEYEKFKKQKGIWD